MILGAPKDSLPEIVGFDNFELAEMMPVPVTIVDHDPRELGREAARMLFERLTGERGDDTIRQVEMPTHVWAPREAAGLAHRPGARTPVAGG